MTFLIPIRTVSEANSHQHWRARQRRAKEQRQAVYVYALKNGCTISGGGKRLLDAPLPAVVTLTRISPGRLDEHDNLPGSLKHCVDSLAELMGLPNDRDPRVTWKYAQVSEGRGVYGVRVTVEART